MPPRPNAFLQLLLLLLFGLYWFLLCLATCYNIVRHNQETGMDPVSENPTRDFFSQENGHLIDTITHHLTQRLRRNRLLLELWRFFLQYTKSPDIALQYIPNLYEPGQQSEDKNLHSSSESMSPCSASVENERGRMPNEPRQQSEDKNLHSSPESMLPCSASVENECGRMPNEPGQQSEDKNLHSSSESMSPCGASVENERGRMPNEAEAGASPFCHDNIPKLPKFSGIDLAGSQNNNNRHVTQPSTGHHIYEGGAGNQQPFATQEESVDPTDTMDKENGQIQGGPPTIILHRREDDEISISSQLGNNTLNTLTSEAGQTCIQKSRSCPSRLSHCTEQSLSISKRSKSEHCVEKANVKRLSSIERSNYLTAGDGSKSPCTLRDRQGQNHEQTVMTGLCPYDRGQPHKAGPEGFISSTADRQNLPEVESLVMQQTASLKDKPASSHVMNTRLTEEMSDCSKKETAKSCAAVFRPEQQGMTLEQNHSRGGPMHGAENKDIDIKRDPKKDNLVTDDAETQQHNQNVNRNK